MKNFFVIFALFSTLSVQASTNSIITKSPAGVLMRSDTAYPQSAHLEKIFLNGKWVQGDTSFYTNSTGINPTNTSQVNQLLYDLSHGSTKALNYLESNPGLLFSTRNLSADDGYGDMQQYTVTIAGPLASNDIVALVNAINISLVSNPTNASAQELLENLFVAAQALTNTPIGIDFSKLDFSQFSQDQINTMGNNIINLGIGLDLANENISATQIEELGKTMIYDPSGGFALGSPLEFANLNGLNLQGMTLPDIWSASTKDANLSQSTLGGIGWGNNFAGAKTRESTLRPRFQTMNVNFRVGNR